MANSRPPNYGKTEMSGSTIGFRFYANEEELEEVQSKENHPDVKEENAYLKIMTDILKPEVLDGGKVTDNKDITAESPKDQRNFLGKRSVSVDSAPESSFSNPVERWKKLSELKEKITKTVEEKISEMKMERNVLGKTKLIHSKENSSISDSEDTSESSRISAAEQWKDVENQVSSPKKTSSGSLEAVNNIFDTSVSDVKKEEETNEGDSELKNRKSFTDFSEYLNLPNIAIAVAKNDSESNPKEDALNEDVESGVEADENLHAEETNPFILTNSDGRIAERRNSNNPPFGDALENGFTSVVLSQANTVMFLVLFLLYILCPLPEFVKGCLLSFLLITFWGTVKQYVVTEESSQRHVTFVIPDYKSMPPLKVPRSEMAKGVWFNEYEEETYDPDYYSVTNTVPVYLELEGCVLTVSRAKGKIRRRATFDEPEYKLPIIGKRIFNLKGCNIYLMPEGLTRKRLFSKKYPIVIFLKRDSLISETKNGKEVEEKELQECFETDITVPHRPVSPRNKCTLFLFARCDRQKEEWYRRLVLATKLTSCPGAATVHEKASKSPEPRGVVENEEEGDVCDDSPSKEPETPFENSCFVDEVTMLDEYYEYMATFANVKGTSADSKELKETEEDCTSSSQTQWFNAFINRILFDVFRSPYWLAKIQEKVQRKIHSIRMPYYVEDIEVIEMDLGKTGPMLHRVSAPYLDDRGLWFDMDVTFNGLIRLTVQTQLNLIKLQKGSEESEVQNNEKMRKSKKDKAERDTKQVIYPKDSPSIKTEAPGETLKSDKKPTKSSARSASKPLRSSTQAESYTGKPSTRSNSKPSSQIISPEMESYTTKALTRSASKPSTQLAPPDVMNYIAKPPTRSASKPSTQLAPTDVVKYIAKPPTRSASKPSTELASPKIENYTEKPPIRSSSKPSDLVSPEIQNNTENPPYKPASKPVIKFVSPEVENNTAKPSAQPVTERLVQLASPEESLSSDSSIQSTSKPSNHFPSPGAPQKVTSAKKFARRKSDAYTEKLIREVSQLAEIAVEEVISKVDDRAVENVCPCSKKEQALEDSFPCACVEPQKVRSPIYDSDLEDSAESSSEEDEEGEGHRLHNIATEESRLTIGRRYPRNRRSSKRIFKVFENVAQSKYFKSMAQSKYIQRAIAGVSAAKFKLTIEIKSCIGVLAVNIPPPPSDRFWYGFRNMPTLIFSANPKIGDRAVRFMQIKNYLQKKILHELKKVMVAPNMIDFVLPTSAPARSSSFVHDEEPPDLQEETISK